MSLSTMNLINEYKDRYNRSDFIFNEWNLEHYFKEYKR